MFKKYILKYIFMLALCLSLLCGCAGNQECDHVDEDTNGQCDLCGVQVWVTVDFYGINDLHGKVADGDDHPGVNEMTTYFKTSMADDDYAILLSAGDMWQGSAESNLTDGRLTTDWMNELDFAAMTLGNHEYDWGEEPIEVNEELAEFPFLAINVYDRETNRRVSYCDSSVIVECGSAKIGIIGAMGDCYSSISADKVKDVYFLTGSDLTDLVKKESEALRAQGVDFVVYVLHDGLGKSTGDVVSSVTDNQYSSYYQTSLSDGYVDLVFEAHTHQKYILRDKHGVYHLQNGGDNEGVTHVEALINSATGAWEIREAELVSSDEYSHLEDDPIVEELMARYAQELIPLYQVLGTNVTTRQGNTMRQLVADLYYHVGVEKWGDDYDIVLGGGFISVRYPYNLVSGEITYGMLYSLFPFDNELVLCSIKGRDLNERFFHSKSSSYFIGYGDYGNLLKNNIDPNETYYIVTDTYSSQYAPNNLTEIERYEANVYARDLLADYITEGGLAG